MVDNNKSTGASGNADANFSSLEKKIKSSWLAQILYCGGIIAICGADYNCGRRSTEEQPAYKQVAVPVQASLVDEKEVEARVRQEYQPQLDAAKDLQEKYSECMTNLTFEKAKPTQTTQITSFYRDLKKDPDNSPKVLLNYVSSLKRFLLGELKVKGKTCPEALDNLYSLMVSYQPEYDDAETRRLFIEKNKDACRVNPGDDYIIVKLE